MLDPHSGPPCISSHLDLDLPIILDPKQDLTGSCDKVVVWAPHLWQATRDTLEVNRIREVQGSTAGTVLNIRLYAAIKQQPSSWNTACHLSPPFLIQSSHLFTVCALQSPRMSNTAKVAVYKKCVMDIYMECYDSCSRNL